MTTIERLSTINVTIDFALPVECYSMDDIVAMDAADRDKLYNDLNREYETLTGARRMLFLTLEAYYEDSYYYENIDAFKAYEKRKNEPDFDWDFYSDWHKDMYGFRPH